MNWPYLTKISLFLLAAHGASIYGTTTTTPPKKESTSDKTPAEKTYPLLHDILDELSKNHHDTLARPLNDTIISAMHAGFIRMFLSPLLPFLAFLRQEFSQTVPFINNCYYALRKHIPKPEHKVPTAYVFGKIIGISLVTLALQRLFSQLAHYQEPVNGNVIRNAYEREAVALLFAALWPIIAWHCDQHTTLYLFKEDKEDSEDNESLTPLKSK